MGTISPATLILLLLIFNCVTMTPVVGDTLQAIVENTTGEKLYLRLVYGDYGSGPTNRDYPPLAPNNTTPINITRDWPWRLFSATGCLSDSSGHLMNCRTGDCGLGGCTTEDQPIATMLAYDNGTLQPTTEKGYNLGLDGKFLCSGCDCPSFTCVIPLHTCPKNLTISDDTGSIVGCKPGIGLPSGKDCPALNSYSLVPSDGPTCPFKNVILQLTFSSR